MLILAQVGDFAGEVKVLQSQSQSCRREELVRPAGRRALRVPDDQRTESFARPNGKAGASQANGTLKDRPVVMNFNHGIAIGFDCSTRCPQRIEMPAVTAEGHATHEEDGTCRLGRRSKVGWGLGRRRLNVGSSLAAAGNRSVIAAFPLCSKGSCTSAGSVRLLGLALELHFERSQLLRRSLVNGRRRRFLPDGTRFGRRVLTRLRRLLGFLS